MRLMHGGPSCLKGATPDVCVGCRTSVLVWHAADSIHGVPACFSRGADRRDARLSNTTQTPHEPALWLRHFVNTGAPSRGADRVECFGSRPTCLHLRWYSQRQCRHAGPLRPCLCCTPWRALTTAGRRPRQGPHDDTGYCRARCIRIK